MHVEVLSDRFGRLDRRPFQARFLQTRFLQVRFLRVLFFQDGFEQTHDMLLGRRRLPGRFRKARASDGKRLAKILDIEPRFGAHAFQEALLPKPGGLDVEIALQLLIDRLQPVAGNGPLSAHPKNITMQGHKNVRFRKSGARRRQETKDTWTRRLRNSEAAVVAQIARYWSLSISLTPPI